MSYARLSKRPLLFRSFTGLEQYPKVSIIILVSTPYENKKMYLFG